MIITCVSDTHQKHDKLTLPGGDLLIHSGDFTNIGEIWQSDRFLDWMASQKYTHKILVGGNHDFHTDPDSEKFDFGFGNKCSERNITYLCNSSAVIEDRLIWGSPITPWFYDWAWNRQRGTDIAIVWDMIPVGCDIVITHGPPYCILDKTAGGKLVGCADLSKRLASLKPKIHAFGHIHEAAGVKYVDGTTYVNGAMDYFNLNGITLSI
jgi:predicted phosphohydrolase